MRRFFDRGQLVMALAVLLLIPLGGVAAGGTIGQPTTKGCDSGSDRVSAARMFSSPAALCYVDQFGNSYSFSKDATDPQGNYLIGTATNVQGCSPSWYIEGSFVSKSGVKMQLTVINPLGDNDPNCVGSYTLKGTFPNMAWYYTFGYGSQEFTFTSCAKATKPAHPITHGGSRTN